MVIALAGNPNSGKTSLFNYLTGSKQHVGNWPGVTVEKKEGTLTVGGKQHTIVDLPGIYTLDPDTIEQKVTRDYLFHEKPDLIINILDASNIQRNLYFTLQLRKGGLPMIVALNMMDEVEKQGTVIQKDKLSAILGVPVVGISAVKGTGIDQLLGNVSDYDSGKIQAKPFSMGCGGCKGCAGGVDMYRIIDNIARECVESRHEPGGNDSLTQKIDKIVLNKYLAFPIFLIIMFILFSLTFGVPIQKVSDGISFLIEHLADIVKLGLGSLHSPAWAVSLVCEGVIPGIGTVLSFLPQIAMLFILMSFLEDSGYMARAAIMMDRLFAVFGLSGSSFIPLIMGFGCAVPAVMSCRILPSERDRKLTVLLTSFMSCSARLPIYALLAGAFFVHFQGGVILSIYLIGIVVAAFVAILLSKTVLRSTGTSFVMEVPPYRLPNPRNLVMHTWEKVKGFLVKAGTVLLAASVVLWFLQSFSVNLTRVSTADKSIMAAIGRLIAPIFRPLGFGSWQAATALLTGVAAKEMVVSTFSVLSGTGGSTAALHTAIQSLFTPLSAYAFMSFVLLYMPCITTLTAMKREYNSWKWTAGTMVIDFSMAWIVAFLIYNVGRLFGF